MLASQQCQLPSNARFSVMSASQQHPPGNAVHAVHAQPSVIAAACVMQDACFLKTVAGSIAGPTFQPFLVGA